MKQVNLKSLSTYGFYYGDNNYKGDVLFMLKGVGSWIEKHSETLSNKVAIISKEKRITYEELNDRINRLANKFKEIGIHKGDRVNGLLLNTNELLETMFACAKIGAIFVPINFRLSVQEVEYIVRDSGGQLFVYDERLQEVVEELKKLVPNMHYFINVGNNPAEDDLDYEKLLQSGSNEEPQDYIKVDDVHLMMYTSGTTGRPKGVMLTHKNTIWNAINALDFFTPLPEDITLTVAPLFHIGAMNIFTTPTLYKGGTVVLLDVFNPSELLQTVEEEKVNTLFLVPAMWLAIINSPNIGDYNLSSLRLNGSGGSPCPITIIEFFQKRNIPFFEGFGLTETAPLVSMLDAENSHRKNGSVGKSPMHSDFRIVNENDKDVKVEEVGELIVQGPNVMAGYWNKPLETKKAMKDGWFYTGDLAKLDEEGFLYIVDRKTDMIITGGENVYPIEVEQVLFKHPNIKDVAVIGYPDEKWVETVKAFIVVKDPKKEVVIEEIREFCKGKLARFKLPKHIELLEALPRNATGKVLKHELRKEDLIEMKGLKSLN